MGKTPKCKYCGRDGHYQTFCLYKPKKPIKRSIKAPVKKITKTKAKDKAWKAFSDYIRIRDCLLTTHTIDYGICVTCSVRGDNKWKSYAKIQAGHGVGGRGNAVLFNEEIVHGQCNYCNSKPPIGLGGDYGNYMTFFINSYGFEHAKELQKLRYDTSIKYSLEDYLKIEQKYKEKLKNLLQSIDF